MSECLNDEDEEESDFTCCDCGEELGEYGSCQNEQCCEYQQEPAIVDDEQRSERQQMGIIS